MPRQILICLIDPIRLYTRRMLRVAPVLCLSALVSGWAPPALAASNHDNYDLLRVRLLDEFVVVGDGQGQSQPIAERSDDTGVVRWADSTIQLGFYIGMLATEYALLSDPETYPEMSRGGGDAADTLSELRHALTALERLDAIADASFEAPCSQSEIVNGFFIRDDVPADAWMAYAGASSVRSDYIDEVVTNKEMSQDQVYHVLMGLALVRQYVPDDTGLATWATDLALGIIGHVSSREDWSIVNPACEDRDVARGPDAAGYAVAMSRIAAWFSDGEFVPSYPDYSESILEAGRDPGSVLYSNIDNLHMAMVVGALGDTWGETTTEDLITLSANEDWVLYPLLHQALYGPTDTWCEQGEPILVRALDLLEELPVGDQPASPRPGTAVHSFTTWNRFIRGLDQAYVGPEGSEGLRYAGIDFLLLHNLLLLTTPDAWDGVVVPNCPAAVETGGTEDSGGCGCDVAPSPHGLVWLVCAIWMARRRSH